MTTTILAIITFLTIGVPFICITIFSVYMGMTAVKHRNEYYNKYIK